MKRLAAAVFICSLSVLANPADDCKTLRRYGKLAEAQNCFTKLLGSSDPFARAEGEWGLERYDGANDEFRLALKNQPKSAAIKTEWGFLFLEHYQPGDAAKLFAEAIDADPNDARAYLGLAWVASRGFDKKALEMAQQALQHDRNLYEAHEALAYFALEDSNPDTAAKEAQEALKISNEALDGMAVLASIDWLNGRQESEWMTRILKVNPVYGQAYATGGHFFEINRRYDEAIQFYRKALELNERLLSARSELGVNLMRLGRHDEAKQQLELCYKAHYRDAETVNSLRLLDSLPSYDTFRTANTELVLNKKEADLLRPYIEPEFQRAVATYEGKYKMKLPGPARLEVYPEHEDFAVRISGLPGIGGLLGVTFGLVVAMDSPSSRSPGEFNWDSTMWHELSHVFLLTATHHLVPRWFTEGVAVHEEGAASPDWGDRMTPDIVNAISKKQLLPVLELDRGFVRPQYPTQVLVSYFQAGKICDYIVQRWGDRAILGMIRSYADRKTTAEAIEENLHEKPAAFDNDFSVWLDKSTSNTVKNFDAWKKLIKTAHADLASGKHEEVIKEGKELLNDYPDYVGQGSAYELVSEAYTGNGDNAAAMHELEKYRDVGGSGVALLKKLAGLELEIGNKKQAEQTLAKLNSIYPEDEEIHRLLGSLLLESGDAEGAVREAKALVALKPNDVAESHFELAKALHAAHRMGEAKDQVVLALEAAPGFKPAQQLLLQLSQ